LLGELLLGSIQFALVFGFSGGSLLFFPFLVCRFVTRLESQVVDDHVVQRTHRFAKPQRVAFVQACWHRDVVEEARIAFMKEAEARHLTHVDVFEVPGSFEIPLHAQILAKTRRYTAIVAAGLVVDGGIYRHEFVADTVIKALMDVQLKTEVPIFSAVLTPQQFHDSAVHHDFFRKHFVIKGIEVAEACANTLHSLERLRGQVAAGIVG